MIELNTIAAKDLLNLHARISDELRTRGVTRSANTTGDLAEHLFCRAFGWKQMADAAKGLDATDEGGRRYQIKACRLSRGNPQRQLRALRGLKDVSFDHLAAVLFESDYSIIRAAIVPHALVLQFAKNDAHQNSSRFYLRDGIWTVPGVRDVTAELRAVEL